MKVLFIPVKRSVISNIIILILLAVIFLSVSWKESLSVINNMVSNPIYKGNETESMVAFECNVVWGTEYVPQMLDIFNEKNIKITFFIGGEWAKDNPELLKRIYLDGHEIGNHGYSHKHHSKLNIDQNRKEIQDTENIIKSICDYETILFAPPYGEFNKTTLQAAHSLGYKTIMWSIDTIDWRRDGADKIRDRVLSNLHKGAFILMHPTEDTVKVLPEIIDKIQNQGYDIGRISDLL